MWNLVALCFDFVPDSSVVFLLKEGQLLIHMFQDMLKVDNHLFTYVAEEVLKVVTPDKVKGVEHCCVHVLFLMVCLSVVKLKKND